jgi:hypothetical protein
VGFWPGANPVNKEAQIDLTHRICGHDQCTLEQFVNIAKQFPDLSKEVSEFLIDNLFCN